MGNLKNHLSGCWDLWSWELLGFIGDFGDFGFMGFALKADRGSFSEDLRLGDSTEKGRGYGLLSRIGGRRGRAVGGTTKGGRRAR